MWLEKKLLRQENNNYRSQVRGYLYTEGRWQRWVIVKGPQKNIWNASTVLSSDLGSDHMGFDLLLNTLKWLSSTFAYGGLVIAWWAHKSLNP